NICINIKHDTYFFFSGDSGYPLELWLFTPFGNPNENTPEARFYTELTSVRNVIERINGILKGRFRCLSRHRTLLYHPTRATNIIYTGCVLHNIALNAGLILPEDDIEYRDPVNLFDNNAGDAGNDAYNLGRVARIAYIRNNL
ncbi:putative nuclease HARBI1, partial [Ooceraea biroi]|uniref:putative nuclease HARBI1 n=1 Tax=Ooceraea biroi TaxID=2015173 RepID=UPI000F08924A